MIQELRTAHRRTTFVLAAVLPVVFTAGLAARRSTAPMNPSILWQGPVAPAGWRAAVPLQLGGERGAVRQSVDGTWLEIDVGERPPGPDLLAYWSLQPPPGNALPPDARLLGTAVRSIELPATARGTRGYMIVYSLAYRNILGTALLGAAR